MNDVTVDKSELLKKLKKNRKAHRLIFLEAQAKYRELCIAELDKMLDEAKKGGRIRRAVSLHEPVDQTKEYDQAIAMLEMSTDKKVRISAQNFRCYVMDEWNWKQQFLHSNRAYSFTASAEYDKTYGGGDD